MDDKQFEIINRFKAFIKPEKGIQQTLMCFGFECGEGWYPILEELFEKIEKNGYPEGFEIVQVKEKFAILRVSADHSTNEIEALIDEAVEKSSETCEECGEPAFLCTNGYWLKTMCESCMKEREGYHKYTYDETDE